MFMGYRNYPQLARRRYGGGGARRRFSRGGRRRYSGARRGYRRGRSYKRRKVSFGKRVKRQAVRAGMRSSKQYGSICKDLGTMFPECLSVKIFMHFQHPVIRTGSTEENFCSYNHFIRCYPYRPCAQYNDADPGSTPITPVTGYSDLKTNSPMGWSRLIGTSGASSMYQECLVVSMAHDIKLDFNDNADFALSDAATNKIMPPVRHFYHVFDTQGSAQTAPTTQATSDTYAQQPDVKMKVTGSHNLAWATSADTTNNSTLTVLPGNRLRWRGSIWPHKAQEIPLDTYIGDKANWGDSTNRPTNFATLQFSGALAGVTAAGTSTAGTTIRGIATVSLCFTCLMKTPLAGVA